MGVPHLNALAKGVGVIPCQYADKLDFFRS